MYYFSYGSNMSSLRLGARIASVSRVGTGLLSGHLLRFHKVSHQDGSAKCDACETGNPDHVLYGVIYRLAAADKRLLDQFEGLGRGYEVKQVEIDMRGGTAIQAFTYYATRTDPDLKPFVWYKEHVLRGAREHDLPQAYIQRIEAVEAIDDPDPQRHSQELSIYLA